jgi:hypothetical protein
VFKYVSVHPDLVPKDLPFDIKFEATHETGEGVDMSDPKLRWAKVNYYVINLAHKEGTLKKGSLQKRLGEIVCYNFYSKKKAAEHAYHYKNNPRYIGDPFKKIILVKMMPLIDRLSSELAARYVLKECFEFKNIYGGSPFIFGHSKAKNWLK